MKKGKIFLKLKICPHENCEKKKNIFQIHFSPKVRSISSTCGFAVQNIGQFCTTVTRPLALYPEHQRIKGAVV